MTLQLTLAIGGTYVLPFVESWKWVSPTDVEVKTYGNLPVVNKGITDVRETPAQVRSLGMKYYGEEM